tara:strand:- start:28 stop:282 length:255 start_codon:yes stop_codon:yes gene_type:complete
MRVELINGTLTKSIGVNEDGETEITVESSGTHPVGGMMNQTIVVEAKPLESVEAFGVKASSGNIWFGVLAVIIILGFYKWWLKH